MSEPMNRGTRRESERDREILRLRYLVQSEMRAHDLKTSNRSWAQPTSYDESGFPVRPGALTLRERLARLLSL